MSASRHKSRASPKIPMDVRTHLSFRRKRPRTAGPAGRSGGRGPRSERWPWTPAFAGVTTSGWRSYAYFGQYSPLEIDRSVEAALRLDRLGGIKAQILAIAGPDYLNAERNPVGDASWHSSGRQSQ